MTWPIKKLGEIANYINGRAFKPTEWGESGLPIIRIQNLTETQEKFNYFNGKLEDKYRVKNGDILLSWSASLGVYVWDKGDAVLNQHIFNVVPHKDINKNYLFYALIIAVEELKRRVHGSTMTHVTKPVFNRVTTCVPPLATQKQIIERMDKIAEAQKLNDELIQKSEELFKAILKKEITSESANLQRLSFFTSRITYGFTNPMPTSQNGPYMVTAKDINDGVIKYESCRKTTKLAYQELISDKSRPDLQDILLTKDGTLGRVALVTETPLCINQSVALIKPNKTKIIPEFLKFLLESPECQKKMLANASGATIKHIYITRVDKMEISVPNLIMQKQIVAKLSAAQEYKKQLLAQKSKLKELFDSVLHKSMKGEL